MALEIRDPMARLIGLEIAQTGERGLTAKGEMNPNVVNRYGMAHGGYLYAMAHLTGELAAEHCFGGAWEVGDASCQYLRALRKFPVTVKAEQVGGSAAAPVFRGEVYDAEGNLCLTQLMGLRPAQAYEGPKPVHTPIITHASPMPADLNAEPPFPCLTTAFSRLLNCYSIRKQDTGLVYALDLCEANCAADGTAHPAAMFTVADSAVGGSLVRIEKKNPITVSASIRYLAKADTGLVAAIPRLIRGGRLLYFYDVDLVDGRGTLAATAHFVVQSLDR